MPGVRLRRTRPDAGAPLVLDVLKSWLTALDSEGKAAATRRLYRYAIEAFAAYAGNPPLRDVTADDVRGWLVAQREAGAAPKSSLTRFAALRAFLNWAEDEETITRSPAHKVKPPQLPSTVPRGLTADELRRLLAGCNVRTPYGARDRAVLLTLFGTALRVAELVQLERSDLRTDGAVPTLVLRGKGNKERVVTLLPAVRAAIAHYLNLRGEDDEQALWIGERGALTTDGVRNLLTRLAARTGVAHVHPHRFRRTALTAMLDEGMERSAVQRVAGHANGAQLATYVGYSEEKRASEQMLRVDHVGKFLEGAKRPRGRPRKQK